jgi:hypothetical protein
MGVFQIPYRIEHGEFSAMVGTDDVMFGVRIEPPFIPGTDLFPSEGIYDVDLKHRATDARATLLVAFMEGDETYETKKQLVTEAVDDLLGRLGQLSSSNLFENHWINLGRESGNGR